MAIKQKSSLMNSTIATVAIISTSITRPLLPSPPSPLLLPLTMYILLLPPGPPCNLCYMEFRLGVLFECISLGVSGSIATHIMFDVDTSYLWKYERNVTCWWLKSPFSSPVPPPLPLSPQLEPLFSSLSPLSWLTCSVIFNVAHYLHPTF